MSRPQATLPDDAGHGDPPRCSHRGCTSRLADRWATVPNAITVVRTLAALVLAGCAAQRHSGLLLALALAAYWVGDMADGIVARLTDQETRTGAVLDMLCDRVCVCVVVTVYVAGHPHAGIPAGVFLAQFVVLDAYLTLAFTRWSLRSPNYFGLVDARVYRWNWSRPAKATNTALVVLLWLLTGSAVVTGLAALAVLAVKLASTARLARLPVPRTLTGCAVRDAGPS